MSSKRIEIFKKASNSLKISLKQSRSPIKKPRGNCRIATIASPSLVKAQKLEMRLKKKSLTLWFLKIESLHLKNTKSIF
jgi:hypothetical protein